MARYIDADEFYEGFCIYAMGQDKNFIKAVEQVLEDTPAADVEEVVRCKDCKQFMEYAEGVQTVEGANGDCFIRMMNCIDKQFCGVRYNDFCSYGERK